VRRVPVTAFSGLKWVLFLAVLACSNTPTTSKSDDLLAASESATFENVTRLGPHRFESILRRESSFDGQTTTEKVSMAWADWDNFQLQRFRNDRLRAENRVRRGKAFARSGKGRFRAARDAELYRVEMRHSASFWGRALEPFRGRVHAEHAESGTINGRPAQRYTLSLAELWNDWVFSEWNHTTLWVQNSCKPKNQTLWRQRFQRPLSSLTVRRSSHKKKKPTTSSSSSWKKKCPTATTF